MFRPVNTLGYSPREEPLLVSYSPLFTLSGLKPLFGTLLNLDTGPIEREETCQNGAKLTKTDGINDREREAQQ